MLGMQQALRQESPSNELDGRGYRLRRNRTCDEPAQNYQLHVAEPSPARDLSWRPSVLPHLEAEAFLSNMSVSVERVGIKIFRSGDEQMTTEHGPLQLIFVLEGYGFCRSSGDQRPINRGTLLIALNSTNLEFTAADNIRPFAETGPESGQLIMACINLSVTSAAEAQIFAELDRALIDYSGESHVRQTVEMLLGEAKREQIGARSIVESLAKNLLLLAMREHLGKMRSDNSLRLLLSEPQIARVVNAITENPGRRHTMDSLSRLAAMTPQALSRRFQTIFAMAPNEYVMKVRLTMAEALLRNTSLPVKTIAGKVGFASRSHFSRLFSKFSGYDPTAYRFEHR